MLGVALDSEFQQFAVAFGWGYKGTNGGGPAFLMCRPSIPAINEFLVLVNFDGRKDIKILCILLNGGRTLDDPRIEILTKDHVPYGEVNYGLLDWVSHINVPPAHTQELRAPNPDCPSGIPVSRTSSAAS